VVIGLGIDVVDVARLQGVLARHPERAGHRLFTSRELTDCEARSDTARCLAARFAAKEAFLKALGTGLRDGLAWRHISLRSGPLGQPELVATERAAEKLAELGEEIQVHVSITHDAGIAAAVVIIETR